MNLILIAIVVYLFSRSNGSSPSTPASGEVPAPIAAAAGAGTLQDTSHPNYQVVVDNSDDQLVLDNPGIQVLTYATQVGISPIVPEPRTIDGLPVVPFGDDKSSGLSPYRLYY